MADAEDILADAWIRVLIELRDQRQAKARGADVRCERARRALDAALVLSDPGLIAAAHADLEQTLTAAEAAHDLSAQAHRRLTDELERLWWRTVQRKVEACIARNGPLPGGGRVHQPADPPPDPAPPALLVRLSLRVAPWVSAVVAALAAATGQRR